MSEVASMIIGCDHITLNAMVLITSILMCQHVGNCRQLSGLNKNVKQARIQYDSKLLRCCHKTNKFKLNQIDDSHHINCTQHPSLTVM